MTPRTMPGTGNADDGSLWELRLEGSSPSAVLFSDPCPVCGSRKRRCLVPSTGQRKKLLISSPESHDNKLGFLNCQLTSPSASRRLFSLENTPPPGSPTFRGDFFVNKNERRSFYDSPGRMFGSGTASPFCPAGDAGGGGGIASRLFPPPKPAEIAPMVPLMRKPEEDERKKIKEEGDSEGAVSDADLNFLERSELKAEEDAEEGDFGAEDKEERTTEKKVFRVTCGCGTRHEIVF